MTPVEAGGPVRRACTARGPPGAEGPRRLGRVSALSYQDIDPMSVIPTPFGRSSKLPSVHEAGEARPRDPRPDADLRDWLVAEIDSEPRGGLADRHGRRGRPPCRDRAPPRSPPVERRDADLTTKVAGIAEVQATGSTCEIGCPLRGTAAPSAAVPVEDKKSPLRAGSFLRLGTDGVVFGHAALPGFGFNTRPVRNDK